MRDLELFGWLGDLTAVCDAIAAGEETRLLLRRLHTLLYNAPAAVRDEIDIAATPEMVEAWLDAEALREVALSLLNNAAYMISRGRDGHVKATVVAGNVIRESVAEGETEEQAICSAIAGGLMDWSRRTQGSASVCAH